MAISTVAGYRTMSEQLGVDQAGIAAALRQMPVLRIVVEDFRRHNAAGHITITFSQDGRTKTVLSEEFGWSFHAGRQLPTAIQEQIDGFKAGLAERYPETGLLDEVWK